MSSADIYIYFPENRFGQLMQIVSNRSNLHELSKPVFLKEKEKKNSINLSSAEFAYRVVKVINNEIQETLISMRRDMSFILVCLFRTLTVNMLV